MAGEIAERLSRVRERMEAAARRAGRDPSAVRLLAVSKLVPAERVVEAAEAGQTLFGENRFQGSAEKLARVRELRGADAPPLQWHFIGHLQSNKVRKVLQTFDCVQSLDSLDLIRRVEHVAADLGITARGLLQVNCSGAPTQYGFPPEKLEEAAEAAARCPHLRIEGLMAIGPNTTDEKVIRAAFRDVRRRAEELAQRGFDGVTMETLSLGMSGDFEPAIEEGSTLVRIGTAIFGPRER